MSFLDTSINPDGSAGPPPLSKADWTAVITPLVNFHPVIQSTVAYSTDDLMSGRAAMTTRKVAATAGGQQYAALDEYGLAMGYYKPRKDSFIDRAIQAVVETTVVAGIGAGAAGMVGYGPAASAPSGTVDTAAASDAGMLYPPAAASSAAPASSLAVDATGLGTVLKGGSTALGLVATGKSLFGSKGTALPGATLAPGGFTGGGSGSGGGMGGSGARTVQGAPQGVYLVVAGAVILLTMMLLIGR